MDTRKALYWCVCIQEHPNCLIWVFKLFFIGAVCDTSKSGMQLILDEIWPRNLPYFPFVYTNSNIFVSIYICNKVWMNRRSHKCQFVMIFDCIIFTHPPLLCWMTLLFTFFMCLSKIWRRITMEFSISQDKWIWKSVSN